MRRILRQHVVSSSDSNLAVLHGGPPVLWRNGRRTTVSLFNMARKTQGRAYFSKISVLTCVWTTRVIPDQSQKWKTF